MDIKDLQNLIRFVDKSGITEVSYKEKDYEFKIKKEIGQNAQFVQSMPQSIPVYNPTNTSISEDSGTKTETKSNIDDSNYITIKSPMIGTFYRKPAPDKPFFVNVGDTISQGTVLCVIEAMKLFNEIESEISGTIVKVLVEDSMPVEYDQALFIVDPS